MNEETSGEYLGYLWEQTRLNSYGACLVDIVTHNNVLLEELEMYVGRRAADGNTYDTIKERMEAWIREQVQEELGADRVE